MKIPEYSSQKNSTMTFCSASITHNYLVLIGDEYFYLFTGKQIGICFTDLIHPDFLEEFTTSCENLSMGESVRLLTMMKDLTDSYHLADITISNNNHILSNEAVWDLQIYNVTSIENRHIKFSNDINKYRSFLSMYQDYLFDYDTETGAFSIFLYLGSKSTPFIQCSIDEFHEKVMPHYTRAEDSEEFENFFQYVKKASENFSITLNLPSLKDFSVMDRFRINGKVIYKTNKKPVVIGIIHHTSSKDNGLIPYYTTKEAKDPATGLLNKRACHEYTNDILNLNDGNKHYLAIIDIDNFKDINDTYGHLFGDEVIQKVASILSSSLNARGICGRFGGDEFYIFTVNIKSEDQLRNMLTAMRKKLYYAYEGSITDFHVTLSIGVSLYPDDGSQYETLFKKADKCLYLAKNKGKNRFIIYDEEKHGNLTEDSKLLRRAFNPLEKAEYLTGIVADVALFATDKKTEGLFEILEVIRTNFELDGIRIFSGESMELLYQCGQYKESPVLAGSFTNGNYTEHYNNNHVLVIGSLPSFEANDREFSKSQTAINIMATVSFYIDKADGTRIIFFYDIFNHSIRWNETDKNYLLTISKILGSIL
ncbi:MAG: GGDEF domain-containing protein [Thermoflexaceae bacterium]|nr:GGDEF domain-containing protein [Thermoflexaceae bacterium]